MEPLSTTTLIVIVIYKQALDACDSFQSVVKMRVDMAPLDVFVYDNSPTSQKPDSYSNINIKYVHDPENSGVSKAYNAGVKHAETLQKEWVLLLDQDTRLPDSILPEYASAIQKNPKIHLFVPILKLKNGKIFSPSRYMYKRGFFVDTIIPGKQSLYRYAPVNSGIMVRVASFLEVGGYNEKVKLDFSDFQFVERFRKKYPDFWVLNVECLQDFSDDESSYKSQAVRFGYFCEGARNVEHQTVVDWMQYNTVVFVRALRLMLRYRKLAFFKIYFNKFLF